MKNILITGGSGFIGSNLALKLINKGHNVTVLDNLSKQIHGINPELSSPLYKSIKDKVKFIKGSVTNRIDWIKALKNQQIIVHLAAETGTGQSMYEIQKYSNTNIEGTAILLDILANSDHKVTKLIVASSRAIYGEGKYFSDEFGIVYPNQRTAQFMSQGDYEVKYEGCKSQLKLLSTSEDSKIHPTSVYGITKQVQEQLVMTVCPTIGVAPVAFRYQNVYGPGQSLSNPYTGILSIFSTQIRNGNDLNIFEDGNESRDFVYIDDVIDATILGIENEMANGHVFNVGEGIPTRVIDVATKLKNLYNSDINIEITGKFRLGDIRHNYGDISKIRNILNFKPNWTFNDGIAEFVKWVNKQEIIEDKYEQSIEEMRIKGLYK